MLADIAHGNVGWADIFFLIGVILFLVAALLLHPRPAGTWPVTGLSIMSLGLASVALGLLVL